jgi:hypothetical protein
MLEVKVCHEDIWGNGDIAPPFLTSALDGGGWLVSFTPRPIILRQSVASTHWIGGWVEPRPVLDAAEWRKVVPLLGTEHQLPSS